MTIWVLIGSEQSKITPTLKVHNNWHVNVMQPDKSSWFGRIFLSSGTMTQIFSNGRSFFHTLSLSLGVMHFLASSRIVEPLLILLSKTNTQTYYPFLYIWQEKTMRVKKNNNILSILFFPSRRRVGFLLWVISRFQWAWASKLRNGWLLKRLWNRLASTDDLPSNAVTWHF